MQVFFKKSSLLVATAIAISGCTVDRPTQSDGDGPVIEMTFSGGAEFVISNETIRQSAADSCGVVRDVDGGAIDKRSVDVAVAMVDHSGMVRFQISVEGDGLVPSTIEVIPGINPRASFSTGRDVDVITLTFEPVSGGVLNAALLRFTIASSFTPGITLSAIGTDSFGNETMFAPFELASGLAAGVCSH
jgi:hypothetical protein